MMVNAMEMMSAAKRTMTGQLLRIEGVSHGPRLILLP